MWKDTRRMSKKHTESTCNQPDLIINPRDMRRYRCVRLIEIQVKINHKHKSSVCVYMILILIPIPILILFYSICVSLLYLT